MRTAVCISLCFMGVLLVAAGPSDDAGITIDDLRKENIRLAEQIAGLKKRLRESRDEVKALKAENEQLKRGLEPTAVINARRAAAKEVLQYFQFTQEWFQKAGIQKDGASYFAVTHSVLDPYMRSKDVDSHVMALTAAWVKKQVESAGGRASPSRDIYSDAGAIADRLAGLSRADTAKQIGAFVGTSVRWEGVVVSHDRSGYLVCDCNGVVVDCGRKGGGRGQRAEVGQTIYITGRIAEIEVIFGEVSVALSEVKLGKYTFP